MGSFDVDRDRPLGFDSSEIGPDIVFKSWFGINHHILVYPAPEYDPMPSRVISLTVPFNRQEGK
jgi:hypothetical protein